MPLSESLYNNIVEFSYQMTVNLVAYNTNLLSYISIDQKSDIDLTGLRPRC